MHCGSCGAPLWPGSEICASCGTTVSASVPVAAPPVLAPPVVPPRAARSSRTMVTSIMACVLLAAGALVAILATHTPAKGGPLTVRGLSEVPGPSITAAPSNPVDYIPSGLDHQWQLIETADDGSRIGLTIGIGAPEHATKDQTLGFYGFNYDPSCGQTDPQKDAIVPLEIRITNPTASSLPLGYSFTLEGYVATEDVYVHYEDGPKCKKVRPGYDISAIWDDGIAGGVDDESDMFLVIPGYYSESAATQSDDLTGGFVAFQPADATTSQGDPTTMIPSHPTGPHVLPDGGIPLSG